MSKNIEIIKRRNKSNKSNSTQYSLENSIAKTTYTKTHADIYISKAKKKIVVDPVGIFLASCLNTWHNLGATAVAHTVFAYVCPKTLRTPGPRHLGTLALPVLLCQILSLRVKPYERNYGDPPGKNWHLASRLSRSLKVTGTDTDRSATYDFLLVIPISKHGPISYHFRDKRRFRWKI